MSEELLGFKKKDARCIESEATILPNGSADMQPRLLEVAFKDCFPVVERKEYDNKIEDMRNTIELQKGLKTLFERKAIKLEQQLAETKEWLRLNDLELTKEKNLAADLETSLTEKDRQIEALRKIDIDGDGLIFENNKLEERLKERENEIAEKIKQIAELKATVATKDRAIKRLCGKKDKYADYIGNAIKTEPEKAEVKK